MAAVMGRFVLLLRRTDIELELFRQARQFTDIVEQYLPQGTDHFAVFQQRIAADDGVLAIQQVRFGDFRLAGVHDHRQPGRTRVGISLMDMLADHLAGTNAERIGKSLVDQGDDAVRIDQDQAVVVEKIVLLQGAEQIGQIGGAGGPLLLAIDSQDAAGGQMSFIFGRGEIAEMLMSIDQQRLTLEAVALHDQGLQVAEFEWLGQFLAEQLFRAQTEHPETLFAAAGDLILLVEGQQQAVADIGDGLQIETCLADLFRDVHGNPPVLHLHPAFRRRG
jgi:hypothetical protein